MYTWVLSASDLSNEVAKLSAHYACRHTILTGVSVFSDTWVRESPDAFESMNWWMVNCTTITVNLMLNRGFKFYLEVFHEECERFNESFARLRYPNNLEQSIICLFNFVNIFYHLSYIF